MKVSDIQCKLKHWLSTIIVCGSQMFEFGVSGNMNNKLTMIQGEFQHVF